MKNELSLRKKIAQQFIRCNCISNDKHVQCIVYVHKGRPHSFSDAVRFYLLPSLYQRKQP
jgi:hypothetical protein